MVHTEIANTVAHRVCILAKNYRTRLVLLRQFDDTFHANNGLITIFGSITISTYRAYMSARMSTELWPLAGS